MYKILLWEIYILSSLNNVEFGKNVRRRRKALGMTQAQLAECLNISSNHVSSIETGKTDASVGTVISLCDALQVTPDYLFVGNMHTDDVSADLIDVIRTCSKEDQKILYQIAKIYSEKNSAKDSKKDSGKE